MTLKMFIRSLAEKVFQSQLYPNKKIILESIPDLSCQTYPLFQYMLRQNLNDEYKIVWWVTDKTRYQKNKIKNVVFRNYTPQNIFERFIRLYDLCTARVMLNSNRYIGKIFDRQIYFYLMHGACIKSRLKHTREDEVNESDGSICLSPFLRKYDTIEERIAEDKFIITGYPRNDYFFDTKDYSRELLHGLDYEHVIMWMPTFRKSKDGTRIDSNFDFPLGIPCIYTKKEAESLNAELAKNRTVLVLKPHPAQDISMLMDLELSNFVFIYDKDIEESGMQLYQFLGSTDALITDYSSVYYDYLLTKKKIGITIDDIEEYSETTGFVFENPLDILKGMYIRDIDDFNSFIQYVVSSEDDPYMEERQKVCDLVHMFQDDKSTKRTYDYIMSEIERRYGRRKKK